MNLFRIFLCALTLAIPSVVGAVPLSINNAGFESPVQTYGNATDNGSIDGWTTVSAGNLGVFYPFSYDFPSGVPEGNQVGWLSDGEIRQDLNYYLQPSTKYTLKVDVGRWERDTSQLHTITLWAGTNIIAQLSETLTVIPRYTFVERVLEYTSAASVAPDQLKITIANGYYELEFDNIRLDAVSTVVPLPASLILLAPGLVGLAAIRRRFKK